MFNSRATERIHVPAAPSIPATAEGPDRRALVYLLDFLLSGFERICRARGSPRIPPVEWLSEWEDDEYLYLETRIPGGASGLEIDLNVFNGVIFARIPHRCEDEDEDQGAGGPPPIGGIHRPGGRA